MTEHTRRDYLKTTGGIAAGLTAGLAGCAGGSGSTGTLATYVSDQPGDISDFEECIVTISEVWVKPVDGELVKRDIEDTDADLVELQGDSQKLVNESEFEAGEYEFVQLQISDTEATLTDGSNTTVMVPGDAPLKFATFTINGEKSETFEIRAGQRTSFTADFTPVKQGATGNYVLQPVADEVTVTYNAVETTTSG